jgi:hypothetical protein
MASMLGYFSTIFASKRMIDESIHKGWKQSFRELSGDSGMEQ